MTDQAKPDQSRLMDGQTYMDLCDRLIAAHPEDLINVISRVLEQRADVNHIRTQPDTGSPTVSIETGQFWVYGCPGQVDCTDPHHVEGHMKIRDRLFSIAIRATENPTQVGLSSAPIVQSEIDAEVGYTCHVCGVVNNVKRMTATRDGDNWFWACKTCIDPEPQPLDYNTLEKGDLINRLDGLPVGIVTGLVNFSARVYVTDPVTEKVTMIDPLWFNQYYKA
jgi:hypothetical protein